MKAAAKLVAANAALNAAIAQAVGEALAAGLSASDVVAVLTRYAELIEGED